jgi:hypothetical protein
MAANVNRPVIKEQKEADVNRKLQIYGIISAFQQGKVPSNVQIDVALNSFLGTKALSNPSSKLSDEGKDLVQDTRNVVEEAKKLLLSKNDGNLLQDFIWQTSSYDYKSVQGVNAPVSKDSAKQDGDEALEGFRTLGKLLITNGQFRKLRKFQLLNQRRQRPRLTNSSQGLHRPSPRHCRRCCYQRRQQGSP